MTPWEILGLAPESSERELKRAYSKLLKKHRPDRDPEGFARINQAFEQAKDQLDDRSKVTPVNSDVKIDRITLVDVAESESGAVAIVPKDLPREFEPVRLALEQAVSGGQERSVREALKEFSRLCVDFADYLPGWAAALRGIFSDRAAVYLQFIPHNDLLRELEFDQNDLTMSVIDFWESGSDVASMLSFAKRLLATPDRYRNREAGAVALRIARSLAIPYSAFGAELADFAYGVLPPAERDFQMAEVNRVMSAAPLFDGLSLENKLFWSSQLTMNPAPGSEELSRMSQTLVWARGLDWPGYDELELRLPEPAWRELQFVLAENHGKQHEAALRRELNPLEGLCEEERLEWAADQNVFYKTLRLPHDGWEKLSRAWNETSLTNTIMFLFCFNVICLFFLWIVFTAVWFVPAAKLYEWLVVDQLPASGRHSRSAMTWISKLPQWFRFALVPVLASGLIMLIFWWLLGESHPWLLVIVWLYFTVHLLGVLLFNSCRWMYDWVCDWVRRKWN